MEPRPGIPFLTMIANCVTISRKILSAPSSVRTGNVCLAARHTPQINPEGRLALGRAARGFQRRMPRDWGKRPAGMDFTRWVFFRASENFHFFLTLFRLSPFCQCCLETDHSGESKKNRKLI